MKKAFILIMALTFILAACTSQSTSTPEEPTSIPPTATIPKPTATDVPQAEPEVESVEEPASKEQVIDPYPAPEEIVTEPEPTEEAADPEPVTVSVKKFQIVPSKSEISYEVGEVFIQDGNVFNVAVGVTSEVSGEVEIDPENPQNSTLSTLTVDISQFKSDSNRRDNAIRNDWLESASFPLATFEATEIVGIPEVAQAGEEYTLQIIGDLTVHEVTQSVTFDVTVQVTEEMLTGEATTTILMSDFGVGPIDILGILKTDDEVKISFKFIAVPSSN
jgi:polyisoprenoid-binding protein YceI